MRGQEIDGGEPTAPRWTVDLGDFVTFARPSADGRSVLTGSLSGAAAVIDTGGGEVVKLAEHAMGTLAGGWSADGEAAATAGQDKRLRLYRRGEGSAAAEVELPGWGGALAWSPTAPLVAVGAGRSLLVVAADGALVARWDDLPSTVTAVAWSHNGVSVGAACYGGIHWFRPDEAGAQPRHFEWKGSLLTLSVAPNDRWVATGAQDASVHVWRLWSGQDLEMSGYPSKVEHLDWDPTSRYLAVGNADEVTLWDFAGRGPEGTMPVTLVGVEGEVAAMAYRPDGARLAAGDTEGAVVLWAPPRRTEPTTTVHLDASVASLAWLPDGSALVVGTAGGGVSLIA